MSVSIHSWRRKTVTARDSSAIAKRIPIGRIDAWSYNPQSRRLRRLNDTLMSTDQDAGPESYNPDDFECFAGKNENYNWKYLGERQMLGAINDPQSRSPTCRTDGGGIHCPANWEMRRIHPGGHRAPTRLAGDLYSKHIL